MRSDEVRALGELAAAAAATIADQARDTHAGIAARVFAGLGPSAMPVRALHDRIAEAAYAGAHGVTEAVVQGGARALSLTRPLQAPSLDDSAAGRLAVAALNGAVGDALAQRRSPLASAMSLRGRGRDLTLDPDAVVAAVPSAGPRLAIFVHGLCETDDAWRRRADRHAPYADRLESELGYTPLFVRYNSGLHVSDNGRRLGELLDDLTGCWPVAVDEIALIGHSMGGLVARSACHYGAADGWRSRVAHVVALGAPHRGAPLEQAANVACSALSLLPETRAFATPLRARSAGIKDLRYGYLVQEDWLHSDPDAFLRDTSREVPFLETANHYFVCATVAAGPDAAVSRIVGDLLVLRSSAFAQRRRGEPLRFELGNYRHVGGATHFDLLNHPAIGEQIVTWLRGEREAGASPSDVRSGQAIAGLP
jgi:pimeloyl-ACP methyl ester carboxylesterase